MDEIQEECRKLRIEEFLRAYALWILFGGLMKEKGMDGERGIKEKCVQSLLGKL